MDKHSALTDTEHQALKTLARRLHTRHDGQIQSVVLFGSKARGDAGPDSDIDVLVVLTGDDPHLRSSVRRLAAPHLPGYPGRRDRPHPRTSLVQRFLNSPV
jgi:predicted nucleotidyltransferase